MISRHSLAFLFSCCMLTAYSQSNHQLYIQGDSTVNGLLIEFVEGNGITVFDTLNNTTDGIQSINVGEDGVFVFSAGDDGVQSSNAADDGIFSRESGDDGVVSLESGDDGYVALRSGNNGMTISEFGGQGILVTNSTLDTAATFGGHVFVTGTLTKAAGTFKIDHPLDPANKTLSHSFVESPDMMNIYNGNVILDEKGNATVSLPDWFTALNKDFKYQLTCIGGFAQVYISEKLNSNTFSIAGGQEGLEVSWQITGVRNDRYAQKFRTPVEEFKTKQERGLYLQPDAFDLPHAKSIHSRHRNAKAEIEKRKEMTMESGKIK